MSRVAYTVIAETDSEDSIRAYVDWLVRGHLAEVVEAGALSGQAILLETLPGQPYLAEARYVFGSLEAFRTYESGPAVQLRAEGIRLFGPKSPNPLRFTRTLGLIAANLS